MDLRVLEEIDESPRPVRLIIPAGYPATLTFNWAPTDLAGYTAWKLWIKPNAGATTELDATPDATQQATGIIVFRYTLNQVATIAQYGRTAIWAHTVTNPTGDVVPLAAGPVIVTRTARRD